MGLLNRVGNFITGGFDVITGTGQFVLDMGGSINTLFAEGPEAALDRIYGSFQEDLLGKAMQGAFGPEGMVGTVIGALPETGPLGFIRTGGRAIVEPTFKAWDWTIQNVVDRPLGTFITMLNVVDPFSGGNVSKAFDVSTWAAAWEINDKRTFGQSVAAWAYRIDPFDDEEYDSIQDDAFFNLLSGTADFFQEFLDPVGIALGGGANILRGKTVIGKLDDAGNFKGLSRESMTRNRVGFDQVGGMVTPEKIYTPGGGLFRRGFKGDRLTDQQRQARQVVAERFATQRAKSAVGSRRWKTVQTQLNDLEVADFKARGLGENHAGLFEIGGPSKELINQRYGVLRQLLGRKGSKMPEKTAYALAKAPTAEAREMTLRFLMGDMSVLEEAGQIAGGLNRLLESPDFLDDLAEYDRLSNLVRAQEEGQKLGAASGGDRSMEITKNRLKMEEIGTRLSDEMGEVSINSVDWNTIYDGYLGVLETRHRKVKDIDGNPTPDSRGQQNLFEGNDDFRAISQRVVEDLVAISNRNADALPDVISTQFGTINKWYSNPMQNYRQRHLRAMRNRTGMTTGARLGEGLEYMTEEYAIPSVITPGGVRRFRITTERLPQALINFSDKLAFGQWERILQQASRVRIGGEAIIDIREINNLLGQWTELSTKHGENNAVYLKELFDDTIEDLAGKADELLTKNDIIVEESLVDTLKRTRAFKTEAAIKAEKKIRGTERKGRRTMSVSSDRTTTYEFRDVDGTFHTVNTALTPQQMRASGIVPRWDLINAAIRNKAKKVNIEVKKKGWDEAADPFSADKRRFKRGVQKVEDGFRIVGSGADVAATKVMQIWRPAVLLTPKWPMRVQLDEFFRRSADLGVMTELRNFMHAYGDMKDVYATHGVDMSLDTVARKIMEKANKDNLGDAVRHLEDTGVSIDDVMKDHANSVIQNMGGFNKFLPTVLKDKYNFKIHKTMYSKAGLARLGISAVLLGPYAGLVHGMAYGFSRYRRINRVAHRQAGVTVADGLMAEGRRLLTEALGPDAPPGLRQQAELMLSRGEGMRKTIDDLTPEGADIDNIVDNMEKAHTLLDQAGLANPTIYGATVRNAYGDNPDFREITTKSIATNKAVSGMWRGVRQTQERELLRFADADWELWDATNPTHSDKVVSDGWAYMMDGHRTAGNNIPNFYRVVWDSKKPRQKRINDLAALLRKDERLRKQLGMDDLRFHPDEEYSRFGRPAENIIDEFDDILPQFERRAGDFAELADEFDKLRQRTMNGEVVVWSDVTSALRKAEKARVARLNNLSERSAKGTISRKDAIELGVAKTDVDFTQPGMFEKKPGDPGFFEARSVNELITYIRESRGYTGFGKSISPNMKTVDVRHGQKAGHLGNMVQRLFKVFGETPADQLSRNPYFRTKYQREVSRRLAYFTDESGNVNLSQNKLFEIEEEARTYAIAETRDLLYDLAEETRVSEMLTHIAPFYNAWQEVLGRWAHLGTQNPYFVAKAAELYTSEWDAEFLGIEEITTYEEVEIGKKEQELGRELTDKEREDYKSGNYLVWRLPKMVENIPESLTPGPLGEIARNQDIRFSKEGLASMLQSTTPGFGPMVTVPIREAVLRNPELEDVFGFMFPFGHPEGNRAVAGFLPAWQQNVVNLFADTDTKERVVQSLAQQLYVEADEAGRPIDLSDKAQVAEWLDEANKRADSFFTFRIATGLFSPTSTTAISPYAELMQEFKNMRGRYGEKEANALFLRTYGEELFGLTSRMTRLNDGVASSIEAEEGYQQHQELIQTHPEIGAWVSGSIGAVDEKFTFSQAAYRRQMNMDLSPETPGVARRERLSPFETMAQAEIKLGWMKYTDLNDRVRTYQAQRESFGFSSSLNSTVMAPIARIKREGIARIKEEHPAWAAEFLSGQKQERMVPVVDGFLEILNNPKKYPGLISRPSMQHIMKYFELRAMVESILVTRAQSGKGNLNLEHSTNDDLLLWWENQKQAMGQLPQFSEIFDRFFEHDLIPEQSFVSVLGA